VSWALVTGGGRRLGRAVALDLARNGWNVVVHYRRSAAQAEDVAGLAREAGSTAVAVGADLDVDAERDRLIERSAEAAGAHLSALVNCAAMFEHDTIADFDQTLFQRNMRLNAMTPSLLARDFAKALPDGGRGAIVNFLDFKLANPYPDHFSYTLSKYALAGATELLARALAPRVRVNAVAPGYVLPAPAQAEEDWRRLHNDTPLGLGPTAEHVAHAVRFLLENDVVTGQTIYVDAGRRFRTYERDMGFM
jgi:NAD(P)-dependent dehydrogenase (short-subunit alcohol dehydrogenase family)